ncbi:MAG: hypothetical protein Q7S09_00385 [bacterium]|nr:hypothetical protein [bacterium]
MENPVPSNQSLEKKVCAFLRQTKRIKPSLLVHELCRGYRGEKRKAREDAIRKAIRTLIDVGKVEVDLDWHIKVKK